MTSSLVRALARFVVILGVVAGLLLAPVALHGSAQEALYPGAVGLVANAGGESVFLRAAPAPDAEVIASYPEGAPASVIKGPLYSDDGTAWLGVTIDGVGGYMMAAYLAGSAPAPEPVELAQDVPLDAATGEPMAADIAPEASAAPVGTIATDDLNLRAGPSYDDAIVQVIPAGTPLETTGEWVEGFAGVIFNGQPGWVDGAWLGTGEAPVAPAQEVALLQEAAPLAEGDAALVGDLAAPAGDAATVVDLANLSLGPTADDEVLRVLPAGATVVVTGPAADGWTPVWYNGTWGFVPDYLIAYGAAAPVSLAQEAVAPEELAAPDDSSELDVTTLDTINLRTAPDPNAMVMSIIPAGVALDPLAGPQDGFYQVTFGDQTGWVSGEYLEVSASYMQRNRNNNRDGNGGKVEGSEPAANAGGGGIIWPVSGGSWEIMQGYNGSSHQNQDGLWQYYYSLDLDRAGGDTAGQTIYSPVNGVVTWTDPSTGGISIDMGDGHAVALFHVTFDGSLQAGTPVSQGQPLGTISGSGGPGFAGTPHVHFTLWQSDDNGNWDRQAVPFTGKYAISGMDFPDVGGSYQYQGTEFNP